MKKDFHCKCWKIHRVSNTINYWIYTNTQPTACKQTIQHWVTSTILDQHLKLLGHICRADPSHNHPRTLQNSINHLLEDWQCLSGRPCQSWLRTMMYRTQTFPLALCRGNSYRFITHISRRTEPHDDMNVAQSSCNSFIKKHTLVTGLSTRQCFLSSSTNQSGKPSSSPFVYLTKCLHQHYKLMKYDIHCKCWKIHCVPKMSSI